jgi:hypothetical protein
MLVFAGTGYGIIGALVIFMLVVDDLLLHPQGLAVSWSPRFARSFDLRIRIPRRHSGVRTWPFTSCQAERVQTFLELNGARSNPQAGVELVGLGALHDELLRKALIDPREPRPAPAKVSPVLETMTLVLERAEEPMRAREIHAAAEQLAGEPLRWTSVKSALSAGVTGEKPHFGRVRHGVYQLARDVRRCTGRAALPTRSPR